MAIKDTRFGFSYQNLQVLRIFINHYNKRDLKEIYSDYVYAGYMSHDVMVVNRNDCHVCYEIKTGSTFQTDITKLRKALVKIHQFLTTNSEAKYKIVVNNDYKSKVSDLWNAMIIIKENRGSTNERNTSIQKISALTKLNDSQTEQLISQLDAPETGSDHSYTVSFSSTIQSDIMGHLNDFAREHLGIVAASNILETSVLVLQLCAICELKSGTNESLLEHFRNQIADFYARVSQDAHIANDDVSTKFEEYKTKLKEFEGIVTLPLPKPTAALEGESL